LELHAYKFKDLQLPLARGISFIDFFYQLNEIFDLLRHGAMRRLYALENRRRAGNG
jgi:hypothetical protein